MTSELLRLGLDAGSTTLKLVATDEANNVVFTDYNRHNANITEALDSSLERLLKLLGDREVSIQATGSAGMGLRERLGFPFAQEVVAAMEVVNKLYPQTRTLIDIGGEDTKIIFFNRDGQADIRMNGNCAGGTGAFIDQMASILGVTVSELADMALHAKTIHPIASRCGVFSKTDIQNLIALNVCREDIAASIFNAVATQVLSTLSRGCDMLPQVFFCGGPLTFIPVLRKMFQHKMGLTDDQIILPEYSQVVPALGSSLSVPEGTSTKRISEYRKIISETDKTSIKISKSDLEPLFVNEVERKQWEKDKEKNAVKFSDIKSLKSNKCFIGIDSGSTTTKVVAIDEDENIFFKFYKKSSGRPLETVKEGLTILSEQAKNAGIDLKVESGCSTGYGEDLVKTAFDLQYGMVETIAHYTAAYKLNPKVSFVLDIGGQDMKAIFVNNGAINKLEVNEACSSGCGSFIDSFAKSLSCPIDKFVDEACSGTSPCDLGTRCTVFMNSKVKQCVREGSPLADISAGLAYSVVNNCLYKVLKLKDSDELGDNIVLQGGTMRNKAIVRAFEKCVKRNVIVSNVPELMGAYGAALFAKRKTEENTNTYSRNIAQVADLKPYTVEPFRCSGCENNCQVMKNIFGNGKIFYSGNKCEKVYTNRGEKERNAFNMSQYKAERSFKKCIKRVESDDAVTIGIPRVLGLFEDYQFWYTLFTLCGVKVVTSPRSSFKIYERGLNSVMADNICFPAKLVHGHIHELVDKKVDRIFYPYVIYEHADEKSNNTYTCPIVAGYSDVLKSAMETEAKYGIPIDSPVISFKDEKLLRKACRTYMKGLLGKKFSDNKFSEAIKSAMNAYMDLSRDLYNKARQTLQNNKKEGRMVIMLVGRPYHSDPLIQHKVAEIITSFGIDVITEDIVRYGADDIKDVFLIPQWSYMNRIVRAAQWVANTDDDVHFVQITSFGCGPDALVVDSVGQILSRAGKSHTVLKVDDVNNAGSLRLRIRSLVESIKFKKEVTVVKKPFVTTPEFTAEYKDRQILVPFFSEFHSPLVEPMFGLMGYKVKSLPPSNSVSAKFGLKYANNEICYPATLVVGDCIAALESGKYDRNKIAFAITQTGGQCRATNYIALIKSALVSAGYADVPVVSISVMDTINEQSGFTPDIKKAYQPIIWGMLFVECIAKMYYATAVREKTPGSAQKLKEDYISKVLPLLVAKDKKGVFSLLKEAAETFNAEAMEKSVPRVGVVGEIFIKYNSFGNQHVVDWLVQQGIEPVVPSIIDFFVQYFANAEYNAKNNLERVTWLTKIKNKFSEKWLNKLIAKFDKISETFRYYEKGTNIHHEMKNASNVVSPAAQFGEGWLIPAEFISFAERGITDAVSLQPFGCIANHVISKGIEKRIKTLYPSMNLLFLDFDGGVSEVNVLNRLHFMARQVKNRHIEQA